MTSICKHRERAVWAGLESEDANPPAMEGF